MIDASGSLGAIEERRSESVFANVFSTAITLEKVVFLAITRGSGLLAIGNADPDPERTTKINIVQPKPHRLMAAVRRLCLSILPTPNLIPTRWLVHWGCA